MDNFLCTSIHEGLNEIVTICKKVIYEAWKTHETREIAQAFQENGKQNAPQKPTQAADARRLPYLTDALLQATECLAKDARDATCVRAD